MYTLYLYYRVSWTKINGTMYKPGAVVVLHSSLLPTFGEIVEIVVFNVDESYFLVKEYETECFSKHYHCYDVKLTDPLSLKAVKYSQLADYHSLSLYRVTETFKVQ